MLRLKRIYDVPDPADGVRVLVERLWPRGLTKAGAAVDLWLKEIAPSVGLRRWFGHDAARWKEFCTRYREELRGNPEAIAHLRRLRDAGTVTLVYAARDQAHNSALLLREFLEQAHAG